MKALNILRKCACECVGWSGPSLSAYAIRPLFVRVHELYFMPRFILSFFFFLSLSLSLFKILPNSAFWQIMALAILIAECPGSLISIKQHLCPVWHLQCDEILLIAYVMYDPRDADTVTNTLCYITYLKDACHEKTCLRSICGQRRPWSVISPHWRLEPVFFGAYADI